MYYKSAKKYKYIYTYMCITARPFMQNCRMPGVDRSCLGGWVTMLKPKH